MLVMNEISTVCMPSKSDLVKYPYCTLIVTIELQFHNDTFLPYEHHLAGSVCQPESQMKPKSEDYARVQHQTIHGDV